MGPLWEDYYSFLGLLSSNTVRNRCAQLNPERLPLLGVEMLRRSFAGRKDFSWLEIPLHDNVRDLAI